MAHRVVTTSLIVAILALRASAYAAAETPSSASPQGAPPATVKSSSESVIGSEDVITLTVLRHPEFSGDFLVPDSGDVQFPAVGTVHVAGMKLDALANLIRANLADTRLWKPEVTVTIKVARERRVYVVGDVKASGAYDWKSGWTVSQLLSSAGGLGLDVQQNDVTIVLEHSDGRASATMPLTQALKNPGDPNLQIQPGDTLRVESLLTLPVYVSGRVTKPGLYRIRSDSSNALSAISEAGGATPDASLTVRVEHIDGKEDTVDLAPTLVQGKKIDLPPLQPGDMIIVSESLHKFTILGYVTKPGNYPIPDGHVYHLSDALAVAEDTSGPGVTADRRGRITRIGLVRIVNGKPTQHVYNLAKYLKGGDIAQNPTVQAGDIIYVPQSNGIELSTALNAIGTGAVLYYNFRH